MLAFFNVVSESMRGVDIVYMRNSGEGRHNDSSRGMKNTVRAKVLVACAVIVVAIIASLAAIGTGVMVDGATLASAAIICAAIYSIFLLQVTWAQSRESFAAVGMLRTWLNLVILVLVAFWALQAGRLDVWGIMTIYLAVCLLLAVIALVKLRSIGAQGDADEFSSVRGIVVASLPVTGALMINLLAHRLDILVLAKHLSMEDLGIYGVAVRLSNALGVVTGAISTVMLPRAARLVNGNGRLSRYVLLGLFYCGAFTVVAAGVVLVMPPIIKILFGQQYLDSMGPTQIRMMAAVAASYALPFMTILQVIHRARMLVYMSLTRMMLGVIVLEILVPEHGVYGAAWGMVIVGGVMSLVAAVTSVREVRSVTVARQPA
jgi:O-antigen/teichoic acid export membrane protein